MIKHFALIGHTLEHSFSQRYFEKKFRLLGLTDYTYTLHEMPSLDGLRQWMEHDKISGFNITIPYKMEIIPLLDSVDPSVHEIGAVNCVTVENERLVGHNTDAPAFRQTIEPLLKGQKRAAILGTGGAAKAVAYALKQLGISYLFVSRNPKISKCRHAISYNQLFTVHYSLFTELIINCTPVGMFPHVNESPLSAFNLQPSTNRIVYDLIYNPDPTHLLQTATAHGALTKSGLEMLHLQADLSWELFSRSD